MVRGAYMIHWADSFHEKRFCYIPNFLSDLGEANAFSKQLLQNVQDIQGIPPILRLEGNTTDLAKSCEDCPQTMNNTFKTGSTEATNVTFNKNLYKVVNENMASQQEYIFGLNFGQGESYTAHVGRSY